MMLQKYQVRLPIDGDFLVSRGAQTDAFLFEVGGKNKTVKQIQGHARFLLAMRWRWVWETKFPYGCLGFSIKM